LDTLQGELCHQIRDLISLRNAAQVYKFALDPDVSNTQLLDAAGVWVYRDIDDVWNSPMIGDLDSEQQRHIVCAVRNTLVPTNFVKVAGRALRLRNRLVSVRAAWAEHVLGMVHAVENDLHKLLGSELGFILCSAAFSQLLDGIGFSTDTLEFVLSMVIKTLKESTAVQTFRAFATVLSQRDVGAPVPEAKSLKAGLLSG
jgi:hypothetical protein